MTKERTTITMNATLLEDIQKHIGRKESLSDFLSKAAVNQLEKEGQFGTRYKLEDEE